MNRQKQKLLGATILLTIFIITFNQFIEGQRFQKVYVSSHAPEDIATEREDKGNNGEVAKSMGGENSQQTSQSLTVESSPENLIKEVFGDQADVAIAIAKAESGMNPEAVGDLHITFEKNGKLMGMSCGIFQIRVLDGRPECAELKNPKKNIEYAKRIYDSRGDFTAWSAYNSGAYKKFL